MGEAHPFTDAPSLPVSWPTYQPPSSRVSELAQLPEYRINGRSLSDAVMADWRAERSARKEP